MSYREHEEVDSKSFASYRSQPITGQTALAEPHMFPACSADRQVRANMAERSVAIHSRHPIEPSSRNYGNALGTVSRRGGRQDLGLGLGMVTRTAQLCLAKQNHGQLSLVVPEVRI